MSKSSGQAAPGAATRLIDTVTPHTPSASASTSSLRDILAHYNVREISPREFSQLIQELRDAGELSNEELKELSLIRHEADLAGLDPDERVDLVALLEKRLEQQHEEIKRVEKKAGKPLSSTERQAILGPLERQLDWLKRLATVHQAGSAEAIDAFV